MTLAVSRMVIFNTTSLFTVSRVKMSLFSNKTHFFMTNKIYRIIKQTLQYLACFQLSYYSKPVSSKYKPVTNLTVSSLFPCKSDRS